MLANYLESSGEAGRVHISAATKSFISEAAAKNYLFYPGNGASREPALKDMLTYFVAWQTTKPREIPTTKTDEKFTMRGSDANQPLLSVLHRQSQIEKHVDDTLYNSITSTSLRQLKNNNCRRLSLRFRDSKLETLFNSEPDRMLQSYFATAFIVNVIFSLTHFIILPKTICIYVCFGVGTCGVTLATAVVFARKYCQVFPQRMVDISNKIARNRKWAQILAVATICICYVTTTVPLHIEASSQSCDKPSSGTVHWFNRKLEPRPSSSEERCILHNDIPEYTLTHTILAMVMMGAFQILMICLKAFIVFIICFLYAGLSSKFVKTRTEGEEAVLYFMMMTTLVSFVLLLLIHSQQTEIIQRIDFISKEQAKREKESVQKMKHLNEGLIENILPAHIARRYLDIGQAQEQGHISEQHDSVCMLFACITNFSFAEVKDDDTSGGPIGQLHRIISDFDDTLSEPHFSCVEKIKSTGPVYMAAAGLSMRAEEIIEMEHVVSMADFALKLREKLREINMDLHTNYRIKIGMSLGPVVAGVIGVSMPQYDLWGNTVNVASRMYSTGVEDHIQVTDELAGVLKRKGFAVRERGSVYVKGKGFMHTFMLEAARGTSTGGVIGWLLGTRKTATESNKESTSSNFTSGPTPPSSPRTSGTRKTSTESNGRKESTTSISTPGPTPPPSAPRTSGGSNR